MDKLNILVKNKDLLNKDKFISYLKLLRLKEKETYKHSVRVSYYSVEIAKKMNLSEEEIAVVWLSALTHDFGKLLIPNDILLGTRDLNKEEIQLIKKHPLDGEFYLKEFTSRRVYLGALEHHERLDGKGYPYGIKKISLVGRIIAIADTFDAMTSCRTYQDALTYSEALNRMQQLVDSNMYDKEIFDNFKKIITELIANDRYN